MINLRLDMFYRLREDGQEFIEMMDVLVPAYPTARYAIWQSRKADGVSTHMYLKYMPQTTRSVCVVDYIVCRYKYDYEEGGTVFPRSVQAIWEHAL